LTAATFVCGSASFGGSASAPREGKHRVGGRRLRLAGEAEEGGVDNLLLVDERGTADRRGLRGGGPMAERQNGIDGPCRSRWRGTSAQDIPRRPAGTRWCDYFTAETQRRRVRRDTSCRSGQWSVWRWCDLFLTYQARRARRCAEGEKFASLCVSSACFASLRLSEGVWSVASGQLAVVSRGQQYKVKSAKCKMQNEVSGRD
jgi:hypothetical protein